jgi:hypothetical protein
MSVSLLEMDLILYSWSLFNCHSSGVADEVSEMYLAYLMVACLQQLLLPDLTFTRFGS